MAEDIIINWSYTDYIPLFFQINNNINDILQGEIIILSTEDYNDIPMDINIQYLNFSWNVMTTTIEKYNYSFVNIPSKNQQKYHTYRIKFHHLLINMMYQSHCRCWNNLSLMQIINLLTANYNVNIINNITDGNVIPLIIQYNETDFHFFQRILNTNGYIFYWENNSIIISSYITPKNTINNIYGITINSLPIDNIYNYEYDYTKFNNGEYSKIIANYGQGNNNIYNHNNYIPYPFKFNHYSVYEGVNIGDLYKNEIVIGTYYRYNWVYKNPWIKKFQKKTWDLIGFNQDYIKYISIKTINKSYPLPWDYKQPLINFLTGFVKSINGKYSNDFGDILVEFPWKNMDKGLATLNNCGWVRCPQAIGQNNRGSWILPQPNQEVIIGFLNNKLENPFIVGSLYNQNQLPAFNNPSLVYLKSNDNSLIINEEENTISINNTSNININIKNGNYNLSIKKGQWDITLDEGNINYNINGNVLWNIKGDTQWDCNNFAIKANNIKMEAKENQSIFNTLDLKGSKVNINYNDMNVTSSILDINSEIFNIKSTLMDISVKGLISFQSNILMINADGMMNIMTGFFNVISDSSVVIRGSSPGSLGSFPPYYL